MSKCPWEGHTLEDHVYFEVHAMGFYPYEEDGMDRWLKSLAEYCDHEDNQKIQRDAWDQENAWDEDEIWECPTLAGELARLGYEKGKCYNEWCPYFLKPSPRERCLPNQPSKTSSPTWSPGTLAP